MNRLAASGLALGAVLLYLAGGAVALAAESAESLIAILKKRPVGMSDEAWRDKRREAARSLGRAGDKRAVEPLIEIIQNERFDAVVDIAVESLGKLGDKRAIEPLRQIHKDPSRDRFARDAAAVALRQLGAEVEGGGGKDEPPAPPPEEKPARDEPVGTGAAPKEAPPAPREPEDELGPAPAIDLESDTRPPQGPKLDGDVLAATERLTLAVGSLSLTYDTVIDRAQVAGAASGRYRRGIEKPAFGYSFDAGVAVAGGVQDRDGSTSGTGSSTLITSAQAATEMRFYPAGPGGFSLHAGAALSLAAAATRIHALTPMNPDYKEFTPSGAFLLGLGPGYGRVVDAGVALRLRRIQRILREARALGRPISPDLARRVFNAWWGLRGELGSRRRLLETVRLLREAGVLLADPDPGMTYQILRVLEDGQLDERPSGIDVRLGVGETFTAVERPPPMPDELEWKRVETAFLRATLARQLPGGLTELVAGARASYRLTGTPGFYTAEAEATYRRYFYSAYWDPRGALEIGASAGVSDLDTDMMVDLGPGTRLTGTAGYLFAITRASRVRAAVDVTIEGKELFFGLSLRATYGLLDAAVAPW